MTRVIRAAYDDVPRVQVNTGEEGGAKQSFKAEADINVLMARYLKSGVISNLNPRDPTFMDVSDAGSFQEVLDRMRAAEEYFMELPSEVRERFDHNAGAFVDFVADPENADELMELGIFSPEREMEPRDEAPEAAEASSDESWSRDQPRDADGRFTPGSGELPDG